MNSTFRTIALIVVAVVAIGAGWLFGQHQRSSALPPELSVGTLFPEPRVIAPFTLTDQDGNAVNLDRLRDHWTFVYLGYTFCPDVCPVTLASLGQVDKRLADQKRQSPVQYLFVSVDPERDTPARLKEYVTYFGPDFLGATGDPQSLEQFASSIGQVFKVPDNRKDPNYLVDHSSVVALFDPGARLHAVFSSPHVAGEIESSFRSIVEFFEG